MPPVLPIAPLPVPLPVPQTMSADRTLLLKQKSAELEATFLAEMLSFTGLGDTKGTMTGGIGEEQFASFLRAEQAKLMVAQGGIGLAEQIFQSLMKHENG